MNEVATDQGKGMKWVLRLVAPFCLGLILVLGWQEHELVTNSKFMLDDVTKGEPPPLLDRITRDLQRLYHFDRNSFDGNLSLEF